jgi:histidine kinase
MNRLVGRLVISHLMVAGVGAAATFLLVRLLAPQALERQMRGPHGGQAAGRMVREQFVDAVDSALLVGVGVGALAAAVIGAVAAYRLARPLERLSAATREMASGRYDVDVPTPGTRELDDLAEGVRSLGASLRETEQRRVRLLGEVAHEMRTPLTVVDGYVEGMIDGVLPADDETLGLVSGEMRRLRRLADDLSSLSRAEEGRLDLTLRETDLCEVVRQAAERLRPQAEDAGVELRVTVPGAPVTARVDADRIAQVVTNLVGNALRATQAGGRVAVRVESAQDTVVARVVDTGEGLDPTDVERVFERFYRVPGRRRPEQGAGDEGSGIGLTVSRRIAEAHGGTLSASSPGRGQGATFTLVLPR